MHKPNCDCASCRTKKGDRPPHKEGCDCPICEGIQKRLLHQTKDDIRYMGKEGNDFVYCLICRNGGENKKTSGIGVPLKDRKFFELYKHLKTFHNITPEQYLKSFSDGKLMCEKYNGTRSKTQKKWFETNEGKEYKETLRENMLNNNILLNPQHKANYYKSMNVERNKKVSISLIEQYKNGTRTPHKYYGTHGWFPSIKNNNNIYYNSSYELLAYKILEQDNNVLKYESGNIRIPLSNGHTYLPDILITYKDGSKTLVEVKPFSFVIKIGGGLNIFITNDCPTLIEKIDCAEDFCKKQGWKFEIWTEQCLKCC